MARTRVTLDYYEVLGLKDFSTALEVKKAYRSMALKHHPDRGGEIAKMQKINEAYEVLSKYQGQYDKILKVHKYKEIIVQPVVQNVWTASWTFTNGSGSWTSTSTTGGW